MRGAIVGLALLIVLLAPAAFAQTGHIQDRAGRPEVREDGARCFAAAEPPAACLVLYALILGFLDDARLSVQSPPTACPDIATGATATPTVAPIYDQAQAWLRLFPGFHHYEAEEGGRCEPWAHPHNGPYRGLAFAPDRPLDLHWFLSADTDDSRLLADPSADVGAMPCVTVRATLYAVLNPGPDQTLEARSTAHSTRTVLSAPASRNLERPDPCVEGFAAETHPHLQVAPVHEFVVRLPPPSRDVAPGERMWLHVEWFQAEAPTKVAQREWNLRTGPDLRPRLVVPVVEPMRVEALAAERFGRSVLVNVSLNTPIGAMDIDPASLRLLVQGPAGPVTFEAGEPLVRYRWWWDGPAQPYVDVWHSYQGEPAEFTLGFRLPDDAPPGEYRVRLDAMNWQHTANVTAETTFTLPQAGRDSSAVTGLLAATALALGASLVRGRRR